ncbi:transcriptional regulator [Streptomyces griseoincarnatus]
MERRRLLGAGLGAFVVSWAGLSSATASQPHPLSSRDVAAARRMFAMGDYSRLRSTLPVLLVAAQDAAATGPVGAGRATGVLVLAAQLAVKEGRVPAAGEFARAAGAMARRSGRPVLLAAAARAAATPLRRTGRGDEALGLLAEARTHLAGITRPPAAVLDAAGMVDLTAAYTAAQAGQPSLAVDLVTQAEETAARLERRPATEAARRELSAAQCTLYRVGIHREVGDVDTALAYATGLETAVLPTAERRARAATDIARTLLAADDVQGAFLRLRQLEEAAPQEAARPSVRTLIAEAAVRRPDLPGLAEFARRTGVPA